MLVCAPMSLQITDQPCQETFTPLPSQGGMKSSRFNSPLQDPAQSQGRTPSG